MNPELEIDWHRTWQRAFDDLAGEVAPLARVAQVEAATARMRALARGCPEQAVIRAERFVGEVPDTGTAGIVARLLGAAACDEVGSLPRAEAWLAEAQPWSVTLGDEALQLMVLVGWGRVLVMQGDEVRASGVLLDGVERASRLGARLQEAKMLGNLGFLHGERDGRSYEAYTRRALEIGRELGDRRLIAHSLCNLGGALCQLGRLDDARACYDEGQPIAEALGWAHSIALFQAGRGGMHAASGDLEAAIVHYGESTVYFRSIGDSFQVARLEMILGRHLVRAGAHAVARPHLERSLAECRGDRFLNTAWQAQELLSVVHEALGNPAAGLVSLRASIAVRESMLEARITERVRLLELHVEAERASREAAWERQRNAELEALARTDALTGLPNRRRVGELVASEIARARRTWRPMALALVDVDHFKAVNDRYGHEAGDRVLVALANRLSVGLREYDVAARWGGEEFCLVLPDTNAVAALSALERLREAIRGAPVALRDGALAVTASVGFTVLVPGDEGIDDLLHRADAALYAAKRAGRDRVFAST